MEPEGARFYHEASPALGLEQNTYFRIVVIMGKSKLESIRPICTSAAMPSEISSIVRTNLTGHTEIDREHGLLLSCVERLGQVCRVPESRCSCRDCLVKIRTECHSELGELLGDLLMYLVDHFRNEESLMRSEGVLQLAPDFCERHKEDHAAISLTIQELTADIDPLQTAELVRRLQRLLSYWLQDHIARHDSVLVRFFAKSP